MRRSPGTTLQGARNFRDVGGCSTFDGRAVRRGLIFRSQSLSALTESDLGQLESLGIRLVCDLRSPNERQAEPSRWPRSAPAVRLELDVAADLRGSRKLAERFLGCDTEEQARSVMRECYAAFPAALERPLRHIFERLSEPGGTPALIHCSAGKDRTGFAVAIILSALNVSRREIFSDYLRSATDGGNRYMEDLTAAALGAMKLEVSMQVIRAVADARAEYLEAAFTAVDATYGSLSNYLNACGMDGRCVTALQERFFSR